jgi:hypothetical protein
MSQKHSSKHVKPKKESNGNGVTELGKSISKPLLVGEE